MLDKRFIQICEKLDWSVYESDNGDIELETESPAGEDLIVSARVKTFAKDVVEYANDFDEEDHVTMWVEAKAQGTSGVPSIRELLRDAKAIKRMLNKLADAISICAGGMEEFSWKN